MNQTHCKAGLTFLLIHREIISSHWELAFASSTGSGFILLLKMNINITKGSIEDIPSISFVLNVGHLEWIVSQKTVFIGTSVKTLFILHVLRQKFKLVCHFERYMSWFTTAQNLSTGSGEQPLTQLHMQRLYQHLC